MPGHFSRNGSEYCWRLAGSFQVQVPVPPFSKKLYPSFLRDSRQQIIVGGSCGRRQPCPRTDSIQVCKGPDSIPLPYPCFCPDKVLLCQAQHCIILSGGNVL